MRPYPSRFERSQDATLPRGSEPSGRSETEYEYVRVCACVTHYLITMPKCGFSTGAALSCPNSIWMAMAPPPPLGDPNPPPKGVCMVANIVVCLSGACAGDGVEVQTQCEWERLGSGFGSGTCRFECETEFGSGWRWDSLRGVQDESVSSGPTLEMGER